MTKNQNIVLSERLIGGLKPSSKERIVRDAAQAGFHVKVLPSGIKVYQVEARLGGTGKVKKFKIGNVGDLSFSEAQDKARLALKEIREGNDPLRQKRARVHEGQTLSELVERYLATKNLKPRTEQDYRYLASRRLNHWLSTRVRDITKHEILDWYLAGDNTPTQTDQAFAFLSSLLSFAQSLEVIESHPCSLVVKSGVRYKRTIRTRHIAPADELKPFMNAYVSYRYVRDSEQTARDIILLLLTTGLRSTEAKTLKWSDVNMVKRQFTIVNPKNHRNHTLPMTPLTYAMFQHRLTLRTQSQYVFRIKGDSKTGHINDFRKTLRNICQAANIPFVSPHDIRRTFATILNTLDVGYADSKFLLNHKSKDITADIYIQSNIPKLRGILSKVVEAYDHVIPCIEPTVEHSRYADGTIRYAFYKTGTPYPLPASSPFENDPKFEAMVEQDYWDGN